MAKLRINGATVDIAVEDDTPLLWVLRDELGIKGVKYGCGIAQCGACSVLVDGVAVRSCSMPVGELDGREITTIEGLADKQSGKLDAIQEDFVDHTSFQCGYCTPGMLASALEYIEAGGTADRAAIREHISGNYCRCTGYQLPGGAGRLRAGARRLPRRQAGAGHGYLRADLGAGAGGRVLPAAGP